MLFALSVQLNCLKQSKRFNLHIKEFVPDNCGEHSMNEKVSFCSIIREEQLAKQFPIAEKRY